MRQWPRGNAVGCHRDFGFTEAQISGFFLTYGVGAFIPLHAVHHWAAGVESKAGRFGTFVLFLGLGWASWASWPRWSSSGGWSADTRPSPLLHSLRRVSLAPVAMYPRHE